MKKIAILAAGLLGLFGATAAQAGAAERHAPGHAATASCESAFSSLRTLTAYGKGGGAFDVRSAHTKRGGSAKALAKADGKRERGFKRTISVYAHVIVNPTPNADLPFDDVGRVSREQLEEQIAVLNLAYSGFWGGGDTGFRFKLKKVDYTVNAAWYGAGVTSPEEFEYKSALRTGKPDDLNLYVKGGIEHEGSAAGWAYMPDILAAPEYSILDGLVIDHRTLPGGPIPGYDLGHTATHEVGHWLGLFHTFFPADLGESGCSGEGDFVDDTPAHEPSNPSTWTAPCGEGSDSCPADGSDPIHNFMNYTFDSCYREFTAGQAARMQSQFLHWRDKAKYPKA